MVVDKHLNFITGKLGYQSWPTATSAPQGKIWRPSGFTQMLQMNLHMITCYYAVGEHVFLFCFTGSEVKCLVYAYSNLAFKMEWQSSPLALTKKAAMLLLKLGAPLLLRLGFN